MFSKIKLRNETVLLILSLVISLIGIRFIQNGSTGFLKILSRSMYCLFFFRLGHWYKACGEKRDTLNSTMYFLILFALQFLFKIKYDNLTSGVYGGVDFEYLPVILLVPIVGIMFWLRVAKLLTPLLKKVKWLVFLGKNTMPVMIHHLFAIFLMQTVIYMIHCNTTIFSTFDVNRYMSSVYYLYVPYNETRLVYAIASIAMVLIFVYLKDKLFGKIKMSRLAKNTICSVKE